MKDVASQYQMAFEAEVLQALFAGFVNVDLRYAVLRNYESLPYSVGSRDIDIVLHPADLAAARNIVTEIVGTMGLRYANFFADERLTQFALVSRDEKGGLLQIKIDFFIRSEVYGVEFLSATEMLQGTRAHNGITVVAGHVLLLDKLIFHLLVGRPLDSKYDEKFGTIAQGNGPELKRHLVRFLPAKRAEDLVTVLAEGCGSSLPVLSKVERRRAIVRIWKAQGAAALPRSLRFVACRLRDRFLPHGVFLSVSGPDGSGKTSVIEMLIKQLGAIYGEDAVTYAHFRPTLLPRIAEVAKKARAVEAVDENYDQPHRAKPSGIGGSTARLAYYCFDYVAGYFQTVRPVLKRREVMLFDRYYYDMVADSFRSRIALPMPFLRFIGHFLPLPQYAFFIRVDPEEVHRRKQELTLKQIIDLNVRYEILVQRNWLIPIENNKTPEEAAAAIINNIVADRHAQYLKNL